MGRRSSSHHLDRPEVIIFARQAHGINSKSWVRRKHWPLGNFASFGYFVWMICVNEYQPSAIPACGMLMTVPAFYGLELERLDGRSQYYC